MGLSVGIGYLGTTPSGDAATMVQVAAQAPLGGAPRVGGMPAATKGKDGVATATLNAPTMTARGRVVKPRIADPRESSVAQSRTASGYAQSLYARMLCLLAYGRARASWVTRQAAVFILIASVASLSCNTASRAVGSPAGTIQELGEGERKSCLRSTGYGDRADRCLRQEHGLTSAPFPPA